MAANQGVAPPDLTSDVGKVRLLIGDTDASDITSGQGTYLWYSDDEIAALIPLTGDSIPRTAIRILRIVALTPAMQLKKWSSADLSLDGPAITNALRAMIKDIEAGLDVDAEAGANDTFLVVSTGPAMAQPALYPTRVPTFNGNPIDPTLPFPYPVV